MDAVEYVGVLHRARKRIQKPERWTRLCSAKNAVGLPVDPHSPNACCWCAWGSIRAEFPRYACDDIAFQSLLSLFAKLPYVDKHQGLGGFNDTHTHAEVIAAFDDLIDRLRDGRA